MLESFHAHFSDPQPLLHSFHAIYFPAMLKALDLPLSRTLLTHSHWTVDRAKMSKSIGNVADPIKAIDEIGLDLVRFYLARVGGRFKDDVGQSRLRSSPCPSSLQRLAMLTRKANSDRLVRRAAPEA